MDNLEEFRYPFDTALQFFGYCWNPAALHLDFAWCCLLLLVLRVLLQSRPFGQKLLALYFGLTMFNNPAFQLVPGATLGDLFGVASVGYGLFRLLNDPGRRVRLSPVGTSACVAGVLLVAHALLVGALYPILNTTSAYSEGTASSILLTRSLVLVKIFVFGLCCWLFDLSFSREADIRWLIRQVVNFALIGVSAYLLQASLLLFGTIPYGTFLDAGYVGFPSFGSVSIERGHFGKFLTPLFPLFLLSLLKQRRRLAFLGFVLVTMVNFSVSSLSYLAWYLAHTALQFRRKLLKVKYAALALVLLAGLCTFVVFTWSLWVGLAAKVDNQAVKGGGGRGIDLLLTYLQHFPLGISYGGSSLRTPPDLNEMNSGLSCFIAQTSLLSIPLLGTFFVLVWVALQRCRLIDDLYTRRALKAGLLIMPFIFFSDILWFVPTIWLPMLIIFRLSDRPHSEELPAPARERKAVAYILEGAPLAR